MTPHGALSPILVAGGRPRWRVERAAPDKRHPHGMQTAHRVGLGGWGGSAATAAGRGPRHVQATGAAAAAQMTTTVVTVGYDARLGLVLPVAGAPERRRAWARRARMRGPADPAAVKQPRSRGARLCGSRAWLARADREPLVGAAAACASAVASGSVAAKGSRCLPPVVVAPHLTSRLPAQHLCPPPLPLAARARNVISLALSPPPRRRPSSLY